MKTLSRIQRACVAIVHGDLGMTGIWHGHRQRNQLWPRFDVSDREANVPPPDVHDRRAAAVVAGVHAEKVLLSEFVMQRHNPVWTLLIGTALVGPEGRHAAIVLRVQRIGVVGPAFDRKLGPASVRVTDVKERHRGEFIVDGDGDFLGEWSGFPHYDKPFSRSISIANPLALL